MRIKKDIDFSGKWKDFDNVYTYIASGKADFIVNGEKYPLHVGNAIIIPPFMTHIIISKGEESFIQYYYAF